MPLFEAVLFGFVVIILAVVFILLKVTPVVEVLFIVKLVKFAVGVVAKFLIAPVPEADTLCAVV